MEDIPQVEEWVTRLVGLPKKTKGNRRQVELLEDEIDHSEVEDVMVKTYGTT